MYEIELTYIINNNPLHEMQYSSFPCIESSSFDCMILGNHI